MATSTFTQLLRSDDYHILNQGGNIKEKWGGGGGGVEMGKP